MSEFAKTIFAFGKQKPQPLDTAGQSEFSMPASKISTTSFPSEMIPQPATPTIALSDNSFAVGTTIKGEQNSLNRTFTNLDQTQQSSNLTAQLSTTSTQSTQPIETASTPAYAVTSDTDTSTGIPRGKLRVSIIEAVGLNVTSENSLPYVVCTFESSEFVTQGPESFDQSRDMPPPSAQTQPHQSSNQAPQRRPLVRTQTSSQHNINIMSHNYSSSNPVWHHKAIFDVVGATSELDISVYDSAQNDHFLGHIRIKPQTIHENRAEQWFDLKSRINTEFVSGKIKVQIEYSNTRKRQYGPEDFEILRLLGKGTFGQVFQVQKKDTGRIYAMKVLSKKVIVRKKEIAHTIGERDILVRTSSADSSFIVGLKFSFQTPVDLYLVTDYMSGGELFWHLQKEGRFTEERAKFYIAELVLALEHLHDNDIVYRDLKPENILLDANGHIALCDFGLSKANLASNGTTNTFCGTTEYLAPEVLLDESGYTKMVDFWSLGVLIFEMCCGWSPFYADNTQQMYKNIAFGKVRFPKEVLSPEGRSFVKGLLNRNPRHRLGAINDARELRAHPFFNDIDWALLKQKKIPPPFIPHIANELDTSNFDPEFTNASTSVINKQFTMGTPLSSVVQENFKGFTYVDDSMIFDHLNSHSMGKRLGNSYKPAYGSLIPGNPNLPPEEEVIDEESQEDEEEARDDMDVDDDFVNGQFDL
ncbi:hypothetical protein KL905_001001 [Ogataea polymorpha]|nr:hypothetical protein KL937_001138 [Ogataea polymorpha]KAG7891185.1 hypothetical protein KL908_003938 [Ogataea polymorpha]KAG7901762.1 hypothetical protein KL935_001722 [Ogataea polymorpha]KAG7910280.1 hypothetical protein KL907_001171 [Ogataea polymorpha]KAG7910796.1 hypothetical protein KL906_001176 [Ogataea polymorpha]